MTNASNVIFPDKDNGVWVDDPNDGLPREPFVEGPDRMSRVVADIPNTASGFKLTFSTRPFPGHGYSWTGCATTAAAIGMDINFYRRVRRFGADPQ